MKRNREAIKTKKLKTPNIHAHIQFDYSSFEQKSLNVTILVIRLISQSAESVYDPRPPLSKFLYRLCVPFI